MNKIVYSDKEFDALFLSDIWELEALLSFQEFSKTIMRAYIKIMAGHHGLSERQMYFLAQEWAEIAIAAFCDTLFRLHKQNKIEVLEVESKLDDKINSFLLSCSGLHPGCSRKFRIKLSNLISGCFGAKTFDESIMNAPQNVTLEGVLKGRKVTDYQFYPRIMLRKIGRYIQCNFYRRLRKWYLDTFRKNEKNIHKIAMVDPGKFDRLLMQMPGITWKVLTREKYLVDLVVTPGKREKLYLKLLEKFKVATKAVSYPLEIAEDSRNKLSEVLFAVLMATAPTNILDREKLRSCLEKIKEDLVSYEVKAVIARGAYENGLLASAAIELGLPLILMQLGGGFGIVEHSDGLYEMQLNHADHYLGFGWFRDKTGKTALGETKLHKISSPDLNIYAKIGLKHGLRKNNGHILFSPFVHSFLYRTELWNGYYPENALRVRREMAQLFQVLSDNDPNYSNYEIYIKLKAFGFQIFQDYEYLFKPIDFPLNTQEFYLTRGFAQEYFPYMQLHVMDGICTGLMYSLAYNFPSVAYWDMKTYIVTPQAESIFKELQRQGVIGTCAEEMAESIKRFMHHPDEWQCKGLQEVRDAFVDNFGRCNLNWESEIKNIIKIKCIHNNS